MNELTNKRVHTLILGAGISGLSVANFLQDDDFLIVDKEEMMGGYCRTVYKNNFIWDYAGHFFHFANEENRRYFAKALKNDKVVKQKKNTKIFYKGNYIDYPFQCNIHQLSKDEFIDCLYDLYFKEEIRDADSFYDMLISKFGKSITDKFLAPYNAKLYACDLKALDKDAMGRFFPNATFREIISNFKRSNFITYNDEILYPKQGAYEIIKFLSKQIGREKILLNKNVIRIDIENKCITTNDFQVIYYDNLVSSIPLNEFLKISNKYLKMYDDIFNYNKVLVFNIGFDSDVIGERFHWIYFPEKKYNFYRVGFYNNVLNENKMSIYVEIGFKHDESIDIEKEYNLVIKNLKEIGIITIQKPIEHISIIMNPGYVHISKRSENEKNKIFSELMSKSVYFVGRYGSWTYCSMEDCFEQSKNVANIINE